MGRRGGDNKMVSRARIGQDKFLSTSSEITVDHGSGLRDMGAAVQVSGNMGQRAKGGVVQNQ